MTVVVVDPGVVVDDVVVDSGSTRGVLTAGGRSVCSWSRSETPSGR